MTLSPDDVRRRDRLLDLLAHGAVAHAKIVAARKLGRDPIAALDPAELAIMSWPHSAWADVRQQLTALLAREGRTFDDALAEKLTELRAKLGEAEATHATPGGLQ
jgi:hypothetical protein